MDAAFPAKLQFLFEPHRYKIIYGGRGGAKSWGCARALLILGSQRPLRVLCARELQNSIKDSVHKLLKEQIDDLGLDDFYDVQNTTIIGVNGTEFIFEGLRHNVKSIKSKEGIDIAWVEEAVDVSKSSWETLIPTIRADGSEIWVTFNPELDTDETYQRFVAHPPATAMSVKLNWRDNPWFPQVLKDEMLTLRERDHDAWLTVWEGHCRQALDGAIYAKEIRVATEQNRITKIPIERSQPVHTFWDLGWSDLTSIWFAQKIGFEYRIIDFIQDSQKSISDYLVDLQKRGYLYGTHWLPHDARHKTLAAKGISIEQQVRAVHPNVQIAPDTSVAAGIDAGRNIFNQCWFDIDKCADGITSLRRYRYGVDDDGKRSKNPVHDIYSHAADAFRVLALSLKAGGHKAARPMPNIDSVKVPRIRLPGSAVGWMS